MLASAVTPLLDSGRLVRVARCADALNTPGEPGSGYTSAAALDHVQPVEIYVLGTSHVSARSAAQVEAAIEALRPDAVIVELCRSRSGMLFADEAGEGDRAGNAFGLSGEGGLLRTMQRSVSLGGVVPLLLRIALARSSESLGSATALRPGGDFRAARRAAERVGASLVLGDRPIEITLERAWRALSLCERWRLVRGAGALFGASPPATPDRSAPSSASSADGMLGAPSKESVMIEAALDDADVIAQFEAVLAAQFPSLVEPLIRERDAFLSLTIKSSMAVSGKKRVLGVVGLGHLDGVVTALEQNCHQGKFRTLTYTPSRAAAKQKVLGVPRPLATRLAVDASVGLGAWAWWKSHL